MPQIITSGSVNITALQDPDLYVPILQPPSFIQGAPTDVIGVVGTASWGPVNLPVHLGSGNDAAMNFGAVSAVALLDPYDLATDLLLAFGQATVGATLEGFAVRVTDGTDTYAQASVTGAATATPQVATVSGSATAGDVLSLTLTSSGLTGSPVTVNYTAKSTDTLTSLAAALAAAVNNNFYLNQASVYASASGTAATIYWPTTLTPTIVVTRSVTGAATETITIAPGSTTTAGGTIRALFTGTLGANISMTVANSPSVPNAVNVTVSGFSGTAELFPNIPTANFWRNLQSALANGLSNYRGPSQWLRMPTINAAVLAPNVGVYPLTGGTDGRANVTTSSLLGSATASPPTGLWALNQTQPNVGIAWVAGMTDPAGAPTLDAFALTAGCSVLYPLPVGTSTAAAVAASISDGIAGPEFIYVKDWVYFQDTANNQRRLVPPTAVIAGTWATYSPEQSPLNKKVLLVAGTERNDPINGTIPYSPPEIGQLNAAGVMFISNPVPGGNYFGIRTAASTSAVDSTRPVEYWRLTMFIARSIDASLGLFVGLLQSQEPNDALREQVAAMLNTFATTLENNGQIDVGVGICNFSTAPNASPGNGLNTPSSVAQHFLFALFQATYLSSVWYFVCSIQGGTTVVTIVPGGLA